MREAHLRDAVAVCSFLKWLEDTVRVCMCVRMCVWAGVNTSLLGFGRKLLLFEDAGMHNPTTSSATTTITTMALTPTPATTHACATHARRRWLLAPV